MDDGGFGEIMRPELKDMKGGTKQLYLRLHRSEVERYYFRYGPELTMQEVFQP